MPVILEEVNPSWIEDGWGIQGDQNEVRFDDDIPWDTTAWTRDHQAEDSEVCCTPPFDCITGLENPRIFITFSGITNCDPSNPDPNGTFGVNWDGTEGEWVVSYCWNGLAWVEFTEGQDSCPDGEIRLDIHVNCIDGSLSVAAVTDLDCGSYFAGDGPPPTIDNLLTNCEDFGQCGGGGTATVSF